MYHGNWKNIQQGDATAMKALYKACYQELFAYGMRILADREKVKDCLHEIFCEIWENRSSMGEILHINAYLRTCLRNRILKEIKSTSQTENIENLGETLETSIYSYEQLLIESQRDEETKIKIWSAVNKLTPMQRAVIKMKFLESLDYQSIAGKLKLTPRTVYNHVHAAISALRNALKN